MIVNFVYNDNLTSIILPEKVSGQFWLTSPDGKNVLRIEAIDNKWMLKTVSRYKVKARDTSTGNIVDVNMVEFIPRGLYQIKNTESPNDKIYILTEEYTNDRIEFFVFTVPTYCSLSIGNGKAAKSITYENDYVSSNQATLQYSGGKWIVQDDGSRNGTFVNGKKVDYAELKYGDMIFIMGMKIIVGLGCISLNNPDNKVKLYSNELTVFQMPEMYASAEDDEYIEEEENYFDRSPRFKRDIEEMEISIDSPPNENNQDEMPVVLTVGPALTMAMASMTTGTFAITNAIASGNAKSAVPTVVMSFSMVLGTLLWPTLTRKYTKKQKETKENLRRAKYNEYLEMKRLDIKNVLEEQAKILKENNVTVQECENRILNVQRNLWERSIGQNNTKFQAASCSSAK